MRRGPAAALAGGDQLGALGGKPQHAGIDQRVVHDVVGHLQRMQRQHGEQARIAGAGARQPDLAGREVGQVREIVEDQGALPRKRRW